MINTNATEPSAKADFTVGGISGRFRTLSMLEWKYIFNGKNDRSRTASVCGITGKVASGVSLAPICEHIPSLAAPWPFFAPWNLVFGMNMVTECPES